MFKLKISGILLSLFASANAFAQTQYSIIVDAGSSGSRLHLFQTDKQANLPVIIDKFTNKTSVPLASFANDPQDAGSSLKPAFDAVVFYMVNNNISPDGVTVSILGTAGMRLLDRESQRSIYKNVNQYIKTNYSQFITLETRTLTGKEEGLYDWLDVNYLSNTFSQHNKSVGSIDMGGASTQIAFETSDTSKPENEIKLTINGQHYLIFSKSFLGLGQDQSRYTMNTYSNAGACYPLDYTLNDTVSGNYSFPTCSTNYNQLIDTYDIADHLVPFDEQQQFIAFSGAYYTFNFFGVDQNPTQQNVEQQIQTVCAETWEQLVANYPTTSTDYLSTECANGTYIDDLFFNYYHLHDGQLTVLSTINSNGIDWTLGATLFRVTTQVTK